MKSVLFLGKHCVTPCRKQRCAPFPARLGLLTILAFVVLASRIANAEILIRWDLASIPPPQALGISTIVVPAAQAQGIKQALAQGYRVYVEIDAAAAASFSPLEGTAGVIVNGPIASDVRERLAQRAKIVRLAENRGRRVQKFRTVQ